MTPKPERRRAAFGLLLSLPVLAAGAAVPLQAAGEEPAAGEVAERVVCAADPAQSYALSLPPGYDSSRPAPVLFLLDARGRAMVPLLRFLAGAQRYGYILASSYNSASDQAADPNGRALEAMLEDTAARLSLDPERLYVGGFSGTARAACDIARNRAGRFAGVIAAGAGFPSGSPPGRGVPFAFFGTVGEEDFNYYEMEDLDGLLEQMDLPHRIEVFPGGHAWMPEEIATRALEWMEMRAASRDPSRHAAFLDSSWKGGLEEARRLEAEGSRRDALKAFRDLARDFRGVRDVGEATEAARALAASPELRREAREWEARRRRESKALEEAWRILGSSLRSSPAAAPASRLPGDLRIARWKRKASGEGPEAIAARRVLNTLLVQTGTYLPRQEESEGNFTAAAKLLSVAEAIRPGDPGIAYRLARDWARGGDREEALGALERSLAAGFDDLEKMRGDAALDGIRGSPRYRKMEEELSRRRENPAPGRSKEAAQRGGGA